MMKQRKEYRVTTAPVHPGWMPFMRGETAPQRAAAADPAPKSLAERLGMLRRP